MYLQATTNTDQRRSQSIGNKTAEPSEDQIQSLGEFWKGIWEVQGECDLEHLTLKEWWKQTRRSAKVTPDDNPIERNKDGCKGEPHQFRWVIYTTISHRYHLSILYADRSPV